MKISDVLTAKGSARVTGVRYDERLDAMLTTMDERSISSVVVQDRTGRLLGIVTDRLILKALARPAPAPRELHTADVAPATALKELRAADIMQTPPPSCAPDTRVSEAMRKMTDERIRHLVVLEGGELRGIVSIGDLVKARLGDYEMESRVLREMALGHMSQQ